MPLEVQIVPILQDNYVFLIKNSLSKQVVAVDPGLGPPVLAEIKKLDLSLAAIFLTHQHSDHIDGVGELLNFDKNTLVYAPIYNQSQIVLANQWLCGGEQLQLLGFEWQVFHWPAHTRGHLAYYCEKESILFLGDLIFGLGAGRLFEGSYKDLWDLIQILKKFPADTKVYCTHEYTETNLKFCDSLLREVSEMAHLFQLEELEHYRQNLFNLRKAGKPSVPLILGQEFKCNPFFLAQNINQLTEIRQKRNHFISS